MKNYRVAISVDTLDVDHGTEIVRVEVEGDDARLLLNAVAVAADAALQAHPEPLIARAVPLAEVLS